MHRNCCGKLCCAQVSFENVDKVCKLEPRQKAESLTDVESIEFDSVYFSYESGESALTQVSCCLAKRTDGSPDGENAVESLHL